MLKKFALAAALSSVMFADVSVTTTIFPLYDVVKTIGGDKVKLTNLVPFGVEAHEFEPKAKDIAALSKSDFFIISSPVFETWSTKVISSLKIQDKTIDMSQKVKLIELKHSEHEHAHKESYDPHYWLSIDNYMNVAKEVATLLSTKDPENAKLYEANLATYLAKLEALKTDYEVLKSCKNKKVIVNHDAFEYLAHEYGITQYSITGMTPETKPSPKQIAQLIDLTKKEKITTVFFEEFASDKVAKSIAKEANVKTDALRPVENITVAESKKGIGYIDIMKENLIKLHDAMDCQ
ncbi:zinc ABC transporter substrate-binding protein [Sulfurospirillum diekertiae]|uniref:Zinc ABC transporter substrate-binding protein n=1 Tax=Sulfurospirillum diekertiae TaxID=1854492 RepID=A0A6G9VR50_9BACT|nr:metal ABC transporter substrate-binding protein [Sulfurospirillum diekertiae]QIR75104.1 zinc ABC transporter substrate-binding protein [Sulfurospirillum diekertiae]QIR77768.1 zinc ABC transporter substrate-binding protein [Sulfurospirillum diekertiae]